MMATQLDGARRWRLVQSVEYRFARWVARRRRANFERTALHGAWRPTVAPRAVPYRGFTFSGGGGFAEQAAAISSFIAHVGRPVALTILSDGSHTDLQRRRLCGLTPGIELITAAEVMNSPMPDAIRRYACSGQPLGLKLAFLVMVSRAAPALYFDSDVLFFPAARALAAAPLPPSARVSYVPDCAPALDDRLLDPADARTPAVNSGLIGFAAPIDWSRGAARLSRVRDRFQHFTEQTVVHVELRHQEAEALPTSHYVVAVDDRLRWGDGYVTEQTIARHYVSPVRHKFWLRGFEAALGPRGDVPS